MIDLVSAIPELVTEISTALKAAGRDDLATQLMSAKIERCTYDGTADAGYIYLVRSRVKVDVSKLVAPVAETIPFMDSGFNIDVDHEEQLFGIEFLFREDFVVQLRRINAL
jgi:uncharacterized protein YuzE